MLTLTLSKPDSPSASVLALPRHSLILSVDPSRLSSSFSSPPPHHLPFLLRLSLPVRAADDKVDTNTPIGLCGTRQRICPAKDPSKIDGMPQEFEILPWAKTPCSSGCSCKTSHLLPPSVSKEPSSYYICVLLHSLIISFSRLFLHLCDSVCLYVCLCTLPSLLPKCFLPPHKLIHMLIYICFYMYINVCLCTSSSSFC